MKASVILGHPYSNSFNHAIAKTVVSVLTALNYEVFFHDLYCEKFDPIITGPELVDDNIHLNKLVEMHCREIIEADAIIIIHPNWWGQPPAILKGWIDRVLRPNVAYAFDESDNGSGIPNGLLKASTAIVFNTSNTEENRELTVFGDPLQTIWENCIFGFCGVSNFHRRMFRIIADSTPLQRKEWLHEVEQTISTLL